MRHRKGGRIPPYAWAAGAVTTIAVAASVAMVTLGGRADGPGQGQAVLTTSAEPSTVPVSTVAPGSGSPPTTAQPTTPAAKPTPTPSKSSAKTTPPARQAPARFTTLAAGAALPSGQQCATWVRARPEPENKGVNKGPNQVTGHKVDGSVFSGDDPGAAQRIAPRIDGQFTGTTKQILRWAACKWGIDEDIVFAQAAIESWWRQDTKGDYAGDAAACPPGHGLGADGRAGECPQSYGIMQNRYPYLKPAFPGAERSTAMNADVGYAIWRKCFEGYETWLNTVERGRDYARGDAWGCVGRWFSGRWHTQASEDYVARVRDYQTRRVWEQRDFQQP